MLRGYNCTIFAYGQTGTGKTYTMTGDMSDTLGLLSDSAGIIPRVLQSLFGRLESDEAESSVKCSFIELYNEELRDLLSVEENAKLKIYDDAQKKGHNATIVQGMEEAHIRSAGAGIKLLQAGSHKRQVAATKCNDLSSRGHTVFTVTVYIKRTAETGEDFVSAGKLNLVDLAGSENIQRSGAENKRAAEAGLINKSLLTLGRVINALVDRSSHIPYRESKLTRLLQDSLGGRTKTCIIATLSPAKSNLEETISTLDYAFRAKNIRNKPQVNQMISKKTMLKEFTSEIEKLKGELIAARQRNGVYLTNENYEEITTESESRKILSEEQADRIETMEVSIRNKVQELFNLTNNFAILKKDNEATRQMLDQTDDNLRKLEVVLSHVRQNLADESTLRSAHQETEGQLLAVGSDMIATLHKAIGDVSGLHQKIGRKSDLHSLNRHSWQSAQSRIANVTLEVEEKVERLFAKQSGSLADVSTKMTDFVKDEIHKLNQTHALLDRQVDALHVSEKEVLSQSSCAKEDINTVLEEIKTLREEVKAKVGEGLNGLSAAAGRISAAVIHDLDEFHGQLHTSYSSLGKDFKEISEELIKHVESQKSECQMLRNELNNALEAKSKAEADLSSRLTSSLTKEREQAAADRQHLLAEISALVEKSSETQEKRWDEKISAIQSDLNISQTTFSAATAKYNEGSDSWAIKEDLLIDEVMKSRDRLKSQLKSGWNVSLVPLRFHLFVLIHMFQAVNVHNTSIQATTKSVHEETIQIVDAQVKDMATQMQALDGFVTRARRQNDQHHDSHVQSLAKMTAAAKDSYSELSAYFVSSNQQARDLGQRMSSHTTDLESTLPCFNSSIQQPLSALRSEILDTHLQEYTSTGETPQKTTYTFPMTLPRTASHNKLLNRVSSPRQHTSPSKSRTSPSKPQRSPSKSLIYTDMPSPIRAPSLQSPTKERPATASTGNTGLREINSNVTPSSNTLTKHSDPIALSSKGAENSNPHGLGDLIKEVGMGPPPLKRQATGTGLGESKLLTKFGRVEKGRGEKENVQPMRETKRGGLRSAGGT